LFCLLMPSKRNFLSLNSVFKAFYSMSLGFK
jgi:hypothetical protein